MTWQYPQQSSHIPAQPYPEPYPAQYAASLSGQSAQGRRKTLRWLIPVVVVVKLTIAVSERWPDFFPNDPVMK